MQVSTYAYFAEKFRCQTWDKFPKGFSEKYPLLLLAHPNTNLNKSPDKYWVTHLFQIVLCTNTESFWSYESFWYEVISINLTKNIYNTQYWIEDHLYFLNALIKIIKNVSNINVISMTKYFWKCISLILGPSTQKYLIKALLEGIWCCLLYHLKEYLPVLLIN